MRRSVIGALAAALALTLMAAGGRSPAAVRAVAPSRLAQAAPQPPIDDPQQLIVAYYQAFATAVNSGDFSAMPAFFTPDAGIDSPLVAGGSGAGGILTFYQKLPPMTGFSVETSNVDE